MTISDQVHILNVEDDDATHMMLKIAFDELKLPVALVRVINGDDALHYLHQQGAYAEASRPALILLNLNLPGISGVEVLSAIKANPDLQDIPVAIFTSSKLTSEKAQCLALGAEAFLSKPHNYDDVLNVVQTVHSMAVNR